MALRAIYEFRNLDSSFLFNNRFKELFNRGVFDGGLVTPGVGLTVSVAPFSAISFDGMVVAETSTPHILNVVAGNINYIVLRAIYVANNSPVLSFEALTEANYNIDSQKDYLIVFAKVVLSPGAVGVVPGNINYTVRDIIDKLGRFTVRGLLTTPPLVSGNDRVGDTYIVASGNGIQPNIYCFDGYNFVDISVTTLTNIVTNHRNNLYHSPFIEQHLSDSEKSAVLGVTGAGIPSPSGSNKFVTDHDPRLPTLNEKAAMTGSDGIPSSTNKYLTEERIIASPKEISFGSAGISQAVAVGTYGPFYVGRASVGSANQWFRLFLPDTSTGVQNDEEYTNNSNTPVKVAGVYKTASLSPFDELDPLNDADSNGFYSGNLWLKFNNNVNTTYKLIYGKKVTYGDLEPSAFLKRIPKSAQINNRLIKLWEDLKESSLATDIPSDLTLPALKNAGGDVRSYLSSSFNTDLIPDSISYKKLSEMSTFSSLFPLNIGLSSTVLNNPRSINVSDLRTVHGSETITVNEIARTYNEFNASNWPGNKIISPKRDDRIRLYGGWNNIIDEDFRYVEASSHAAISITFYGNSVDLLINLKPDLPQLTTTIDGVTGPAIDPTISGSVSDVLSNQNYNVAIPLNITGGLSTDIHTVDVTIGDATGSFELHGFKVKNTATNFVTLPGRAFSSTQLIKHDTITGASIPFVGLYSRGGKLIQYLNRATGSHNVEFDQINVDGYRATNGLSVLNNDTISNLSSTSDMRVNDIVTVNTSGGMQITVIKTIFSSDTIILFDKINYSSTNVSVTLYGRTTTSVDHTDEEIIKRLDPLNFTSGLTNDFGNILIGVTGDAAFTLEDNTTTIAAKNFSKEVLDGSVSEGTITLNAYQTGIGATAGISDGDTFVIYDGLDRTFEFSATGTFGAGNFGITVDYGDSSSDLQTKTTQGINSSTTNLIANVAGEFDVRIANTNVGDNNKTITESISNGLTLNPIGMLGGSEPANIAVDVCLVGSGSDSFLRIMFLGTGLDLITANTVDLGSTRSLVIDGISFESASFVSIPYNGLTRLPIVSNLPYGTHVVDISSEGIAFAYLLIYEPKTVYDGTPIAEMTKLSAIRLHDSGITGDLPSSTSNGVVSHTATREFRFIDGITGGYSWVKNELDFDAAPKTGFILNTSRKNGYFELEFYGTGFQLEYPINSLSGRSSIYLDGVLVNSTNYPTATISSTLNSTVGKSAGQMQQNSVSSLGGLKNIWAYNFSLGYHKLKVILDDDTYFLNIELVNVFTDYSSNIIEITPIDQERLEPGNTIKDLRNVLAILPDDSDVILDDTTNYAKVNENEIITGNYIWSRPSKLPVISAKRNTDIRPRFEINTDGDMFWGNGINAFDLTYKRVQLSTFGDVLQFNGLNGSSSSVNITKTGHLLLYGGTPELQFHEYSAPTNKKSWALKMNDGVFKVTSVSDSFTTPIDALTLDRRVTASNNETLFSVIGVDDTVTTINPIFELYKKRSVAGEMLGSIDWAYGTTKTTQGRLMMINDSGYNQHANFYFYNLHNGSLVNTAWLDYTGQWWVQNNVVIGVIPTPLYDFNVCKNVATAGQIKSTNGTANFNLSYSTGNSSAYNLLEGTTLKGQLSASGTTVNVLSLGDLNWFTDSANRMTLDTFGQLYIQTSLGVGRTPTVKLDIYEPTASVAVGLIKAAAGVAEFQIDSAAANNAKLSFLIAGAKIWSMESNATTLHLKHLGVTDKLTFTSAGTLWVADRIGLGAATTPVHAFDCRYTSGNATILLATNGPSSEMTFNSATDTAIYFNKANVNQSYLKQDSGNVAFMANGCTFKNQALTDIAWLNNVGALWLSSGLLIGTATFPTTHFIDARKTTGNATVFIGTGTGVSEIYLESSAGNAINFSEASVIKGSIANIAGVFTHFGNNWVFKNLASSIISTLSNAGALWVAERMTIGAGAPGTAQIDVLNASDTLVRVRSSSARVGLDLDAFATSSEINFLANSIFGAKIRYNNPTAIMDFVSGSFVFNNYTDPTTTPIATISAAGAFWTKDKVIVGTAPGTAQLDIQQSPDTLVRIRSTTGLSGLNLDAAGDFSEINFLQATTQYAKIRYNNVSNEFLFRSDGDMHMQGLTVPTSRFSFLSSGTLDVSNGVRSGVIGGTNIPLNWKVYTLSAGTVGTLVITIDSTPTFTATNIVSFSVAMASTTFDFWAMSGNNFTSGYAFEAMIDILGGSVILHINNRGASLNSTDTRIRVVLFYRS